MKLLFLTPALPYPPLAGNAMIALNHIRRLAERHTVDLISFKDPGKVDDLGELSCCRHIQLVDRPPAWRMFLNMVEDVPQYIPFGVSRLRSKEMTQVVASRATQENYEAIFFQLSEMAQFRPRGFAGVSIWGLEDPPVLKYQRMEVMYPRYLKPLNRDRMARHKRYEMLQAPYFDCIVFVNQADARDYRQILKDAELDWVPSGIDDSGFSPAADVLRRDGMIVITGNMFHPPNVDAVEYFCREIFPEVSRRVPAANLWLVGSRPVRAVSKWADDPRIKVTGFVPDVRPYLRRARVSACPVRLRIGTQTKVLEAMACGTPVVTSAAGNHGIGGVSGEHLYVADDPSQFADRVVALLRGERWEELSRNGRRFVVGNFSWEASTAKLEGIMEHLVDARMASSASV